MRLRNRFFLLRHGESQANLQDKIISDPIIGCQQFGLSELGKEQARISTQESGLGPDTIVIASDFLRTQETARIAAQVLGVQDVKLEARLRERYFGELDQGPAQSYQQVWDLDQAGQTVGWGVERAEDLTRRLVQVIEELEQSTSDCCYLLVSHGDPLRYLQLWGAGRPLHQHQTIRHFAPAELRSLLDAPSP